MANQPLYTCLLSMQQHKAAGAEPAVPVSLTSFITSLKCPARQLINLFIDWATIIPTSVYLPVPTLLSSPERDKHASGNTCTLEQGRFIVVVQTFPMGSHYHKQNWFSNKVVYLNSFGYSLAIISVLLI